MTKGQMIRMVKKMDNSVLALNIQVGHELKRRVLDKSEAEQMDADLVLLKDELKTRGWEATEVPHGDHTHIEFVPYDLKAKADVTMTIPSVNDLIAGPVAKDLPKHGYLSPKPA